MQIKVLTLGMASKFALYSIFLFQLHYKDKLVKLAILQGLGRILGEAVSSSTLEERQSCLTAECTCRTATTEGWNHFPIRGPSIRSANLGPT